MITSARSTRTATTLTILVLAACPGPKKPLMRVKPAWIPSPNRTHPDLLYVTGSCRGIRHRELARRCAVADAKFKIRRALKKEKLAFRASYIEDEHHEIGGSPQRQRYDWWILVAYPRRPAKGAAPAADAAAARCVAAGDLSTDEQALLASWRRLNDRSRQALKSLITELDRQPTPSPPASD